MRYIKPCDLCQEKFLDGHISFIPLILGSRLHVTECSPYFHSSSQQATELAIWAMNNEWLSILLVRQVKQVGCEKSAWMQHKLPSINLIV